MDPDYESGPRQYPEGFYHGHEVNYIHQYGKKVTELEDLEKGYSVAGYDKESGDLILRKQLPSREGKSLESSIKRVKPALLREMQNVRME